MFEVQLLSHRLSVLRVVRRSMFEVRCSKFDVRSSASKPPSVGAPRRSTHCPPKL